MSPEKVETSTEMALRELAAIKRVLDARASNRIVGEMAIWEMMQAELYEFDELKAQIEQRRVEDCKIAVEIADENLGSGRGKLAAAEQAHEDAENALAAANKHIGDLREVCDKLKTELAIEEDISAEWKRTAEANAIAVSNLQNRNIVITAMVRGVLDGPI